MDNYFATLWSDDTIVSMELEYVWRYGIFTRQYLYFSFFTGLGGPSVVDHAAVQACVCLCGVTDDESTAGQCEDSLVQLNRLFVLFPVDERHQVWIHLTVQQVTVTHPHRRGFRLTEVPRYPWKQKNQNQNKYILVCKFHLLIKNYMP